MIRQFLVRAGNMSDNSNIPGPVGRSYDKPRINHVIDLDVLPSTNQSNRVIACLDVRSNDDGDLVVTKGDQYDVRERMEEGNVGRLISMDIIYHAINIPLY